MKPSSIIIGLAALIAALALIAAGAGLFWQAGGSPFTVTTLRGQTVTMYGQGLYRFDTRFMGAGNRGTDAVTLALGIPLLIMATRRYRRGSLRWGLLLVGTLVYFLYVYASLALNAAYNDLFLVYVVLFSASLFAVVLIYASIDLSALQAHFLPSLPRRGPALFMFASGLVTLLIWLAPLLSALFQGQPPELLGSSTTMVTDALDLGIITPATIIAGVLILRRAPLGYLIACSLLVLEMLLAPMIAAQTISQMIAGVTFSTGQIVGPIAGFSLLALAAVVVTTVLLRTISDSAQVQAPALQPAHT
ncbi:hypothetical protein K2Z83_23040 [Oscillochloris sp. ZM17-4]|uniref:hypothetical protein n=1 Tax=Oscillochloris sp. ZM17-4 TaxID=2866714 RepID=UPI001C735AB7|nr:hypothetical protein [Oscillochloris sp. ZM17-4]MBX0330536.1 hypothetical protein [Oscillochloris sp. ZM17-4]